MTSLFLSTLNESTNKYLTHVNEQGAAAGVAPVGLGDLDLAAFLGWVIENPPAEVVVASPAKGTPREGTTCHAIWAYLDGLVSSKTQFTRAQVVAALEGAGYNKATVQTQYQRWVKAHPAATPAPVVALPKPPAVAVPPTVHKAAPVEAPPAPAPEQAPPAQ